MHPWPFSPCFPWARKRRAFFKCLVRFMVGNFPSWNFNLQIFGFNLGSTCWISSCWAGKNFGLVGYTPNIPPIYSPCRMHGTSWEWYVFLFRDLPSNSSIHVGKYTIHGLYGWVGYNPLVLNIDSNFQANIRLQKIFPEQIQTLVFNHGDESHGGIKQSPTTWNLWLSSILVVEPSKTRSFPIKTWVTWVPGKQRKVTDTPFPFRHL